MQIRCLCGQSFSIPAETFWTVSCYACGRKLSATADGKVLELAGPKPEHQHYVQAAGATLPAPPRQACLTCRVCGADLHDVCAWCGEPHCFLHAPKDHPGPLPPIGGPARELYTPFLVYVMAPVVIGVIGLLLWILL